MQFVRCKLPDVTEIFSPSSSHSERSSENWSHQLFAFLWLSTSFHDLGLIPGLSRPGNVTQNPGLSRICTNPELFRTSEVCLCAQRYMFCIMAQTPTVCILFQFHFLSRFRLLTFVSLFSAAKTELIMFTFCFSYH